MKDKNFTQGENSELPLPPQLSRCTDLYRLFSASAVQHKKQCSNEKMHSNSSSSFSAQSSEPNFHENALLGKALIECQSALFEKFTNDAEHAARLEESRSFMRRSLSGDSGW